MKYALEIEINLPRQKVVELFDSTENLKKWQPGLLSFDAIEGEPGKVGTKSRLFYKMGKREVEMIETITVMNFPKEFSAIYEAKGVWNEVKNFFIEEGDKTLWKTEHEFLGKGFMKIMMALMPGMFKKQSLKYMSLFKEFAETGKTVV